ncbi:MAG: GNAT family N-acetyltransferase [Aridibacter famidurans]|nr:GNAT family N-acetyltransferase [Aridibacter famidurans]
MPLTNSGGAKKTYCVKNVSWKGHYKRLSALSLGTSGSVVDDEKSMFFDVPLSACVTSEDIIIAEDRFLYVSCRNGLSQIAPSYLSRDKLRVGGLEVSALIKEITQADEHESYQALAKFHYRDQPLFGRTARLIARTFHPAYPKILGFIELATPFYMNKARSQLLDAPFHNGTVSWDGWNMATTRYYIHLIVRIARCVIHPEFRGLGLGQVLVQHATQFARARWQVAGFLPYFMEISADMLKYVPFAERAGMSFIGETEGNLDRVAKDMGYLMKNAERVRNGEIVSEDSCGIVDQQVARMERVLKLQDENDLTRKELLSRLARLSTDDVLRDYAMFWDIISLPKPTYMKGLTKKASKFVQSRVSEISPANGWQAPSLRIQPIAEPIRVENLSLTYYSKVRRTRQTHAVQQAFGLSPEDILNVVIRDLSLDVGAGEIVLITGPSGSGKTTLLHVLAQGSCQDGLKKQGKITYPPNSIVGTFKPIRSRKALVEIFSADESAGNVHGALHLMGTVGLSDAFVFLKRFGELSKGQQHRAMLADLIAQRSNVWFVDEFCSNLDTVTANVVADRLQKLARRYGATLIVAAPHCELFLHALRPDKVVLLTNAWEHATMSGDSFMGQLQKPDRWGRQIRRLKLRQQQFEAACRGDKTMTIRKNRLSVTPGPLLLANRGENLLVNVRSVSHVTVEELTEDHARQDGFESLDAFKVFLREVYHSLKETSPLTVIEFERF